MSMLSIAKSSVVKSSVAALCGAAGLLLIGCQGASAVPAAASAVTAMSAAALPLQPVQFREYRTRRGYVKCYRDFVFGPYRCHYYRRWR